VTRPAVGLSPEAGGGVGEGTGEDGLGAVADFASAWQNLTSAALGPAPEASMAMVRTTTATGSRRCLSSRSSVILLLDRRSATSPPATWPRHRLFGRFTHSPARCVPEERGDGSTWDPVEIPLRARGWRAFLTWQKWPPPQTSEAVYPGFWGLTDLSAGFSWVVLARTALFVLFRFDTAPGGRVPLHSRRPGSQRDRHLGHPRDPGSVRARRHGDDAV
jgi:hypothetical protein